MINFTNNEPTCQDPQTRQKNRKKAAQARVIARARRLKEKRENKNEDGPRGESLRIGGI
jgi:hypothetical protein